MAMAMAVKRRAVRISEANIVKKVLLRDLEEDLSESQLRARGEDCVASFNLMEGHNVAITVPGLSIDCELPLSLELTVARYAT